MTQPRSVSRSRRLTLEIPRLPRNVMPRQLRRARAHQKSRMFHPAQPADSASSRPAFAYPPPPVIRVANRALSVKAPRSLALAHLCRRGTCAVPLSPADRRHSTYTVVTAHARVSCKETIRNVFRDNFSHMSLPPCPSMCAAGTISSFLVFPS